ncbi:MAG: hypothetical protein PUC33_06780, partial [Oscillospiraceae bacterium]|nr:hypothetical protein [Oscillospiraceae bacterium]
MGKIGAVIAGAQCKSLFIQSLTHLFAMNIGDIKSYDRSLDFGIHIIIDRNAFYGGNIAEDHFR